MPQEKTREAGVLSKTLTKISVSLPDVCSNLAIVLGPSPHLVKAVQLGTIAVAQKGARADDQCFVGSFPLRITKIGSASIKGFYRYSTTSLISAHLRILLS